MKPDILVHTHFLAPELVASLRRRHGLKVPQVTVAPAFSVFIQCKKPRSLTWMSMLGGISSREPQLAALRSFATAEGQLTSTSCRGKWSGAKGTESNKVCLFKFLARPSSNW